MEFQDSRNILALRLVSWMDYMGFCITGIFSQFYKYYFVMAKYLLKQKGMKYII